MFLIKPNKNVLIGCLCALGCEIIFGFSFLFTKDATATVSVFALLGWRFLVAFIAMTIFASAGLMKVKLKGKKLKPLFIVALLSPVIYYIGETFGIGFTTASESGTFLACIPVASLFASTLILKEKPTRMQIAGISVTLAGAIVTVFAVGSTASFSVIGYLMLCIAVVSYALYSVLVEKAVDYTGAEITYVMLAAGAVFFVIAAVAEALFKGSIASLVSLPFAEPGFLIAVLYLGIGCSVFAFFMSNVAISTIGVNRTASFIGVTTVVSIMAGILILHEPFTKLQIIGAIIIICGVYIANSKNPTH